MSYATIGVVSNYAAGVSVGYDKVVADDLNQTVGKLGSNIADLFANVIQSIPDSFDSAAMHALDSAFI
jgi:purine nucleoside phosphorylase